MLLITNRMKKKKIIGYTTGVFDLFHIGHLHTLREARKKCDYLIVGVTTDSLALKHKKMETFIPYKDRVEIVRSLEFVDEVVPQRSMNKIAAWKRHKFDKMFVGKDGKGTESWNKHESDFKLLGVRIIYFSLVKGVSSTLTRNLLRKKGLLKNLLAENSTRRKNK